MRDLEQMADSADEKAFHNLKMAGGGGSSWREAAFQWFAIADALRSRAATKDKGGEHGG